MRNTLQEMEVLYEKEEKNTDNYTHNHALLGGAGWLWKIAGSI